MFSMNVPFRTLFIIPLQLIWANWSPEGYKKTRKTGGLKVSGRRPRRFRAVLSWHFGGLQASPRCDRKLGFRYGGWKRLNFKKPAFYTLIVLEPWTVLTLWNQVLNGKGGVLEWKVSEIGLEGVLFPSDWLPLLHIVFRSFGSIPWKACLNYLFFFVSF